jgi:adenylate cyclase
VAALNTEAAVPERTPVVILFAETRGFTRTSAILEPTVVFSRVGEFFALVATVMERNGGVVRDMLNDTLMATFAGDGAALHAARAAEELQRDFSVLEEAWHGEYGIRAAVAMGLHTGEVVIGSAEGPLAGRTLIVGDSVSVANRLLHRARAGEFVLSNVVMDALASAGVALDAEPLPPLAMPRRDPIPLFGVLRDTRLDFT